MIKSPIRDDDDTPSFEIKISDAGFIYWKDYGLTNQIGFDLISLVEHLLNVNKEEAIKAIWDKIESGNITNAELKIPQKVKQKVIKKNINDFSYWTERHVSKKTIIKYNTFEVKYLIKNYSLYKVTEPTYFYLINNDSWQTYCPSLPKKYRFNSYNTNVVAGAKQITNKYNKLIVTKSYKDLLVLSEFSDIVECDVIATMSENSIDKIINFIKSYRSNHRIVYILFDNDRVGISQSEILKNKLIEMNLGLTVISIFVPSSIGKDPAKAAQELSRNDFAKLLLNIISQ